MDTLNISQLIPYLYRDYYYCNLTISKKLSVRLCKFFFNKIPWHKYFRIF